MNLRVLSFFLLVALGFTAALADASFSVPSAHPRLLITTADIEPLRTRATTISPFREAYSAAKNRVDSWSSPTTNRYVLGAQIQAIVFVALVERFDAAYVNKVDTWLLNFFVTQGGVALALSGDGGTIWGSADIILGVAMAYDWLYPVLSPAKRLQYGTYLKDFQKAVITQQGGMTRDASRSDYSNQFYYFDGMLAITGVALYNEGIDDALASTYLTTFDGYVHNSMIPVVNQIGGANGGWHEGLGYVDRALTYFSLQLEAWRVGAGENLFPVARGLARLHKWLLYSTQPDGYVVNVGDVSDWPTGWSEQTARRATLLAARYQDGFSQHVASQVSPTASQNWPYTIFYLLWHDPGVSAVNLATLPTAEHFDGIGWVSMRENWSATATFAVFYSGNYYFGHQHYDQNSFQIFRYAPLAIDNGIYNVGIPGYKTATRFHNTILVGDPGADASSTDGDSGQTGASPMSYIPNPESSTSNKGDILLFEDDAAFTYVIGDASKAYKPTRLTTYVRKFLYVKPDLFLVLDRVVLPTSTYPIRWLLQADNSPTVSGNQIAITNGNGRLFAKTLLPGAVTLSVQTVFSGVAQYGSGNYRLEVIPASNQTEEHFLHVLWATEAQATTMPAVTSLATVSGNLVGANVSNSVILLSKSGSVDTRETYSVSSSSVLNHLIGDLLPGGGYGIYRDGLLMGTPTASGGGTLQFSSSGGGTFEIVFLGTQADLDPPAPPTSLSVR